MRLFFTSCLQFCSTEDGTASYLQYRLSCSADLKWLERTWNGNQFPLDLWEKPALWWFIPITADHADSSVWQQPAVTVRFTRTAVKKKKKIWGVFNLFSYVLQCIRSTEITWHEHGNISVGWCWWEKEAGAATGALHLSARYQISAQ